MNRSTFLITLGILCLCATALIAQRIHLKRLRQSLVQISQKTTQLERRNEFVNLTTHDPLSSSSTLLHSSTSLDSSQRLQKASRELESLIDEKPANIHGPADFLAALSDLLKIIQDLDSSELLQLVKTLSTRETDSVSVDQFLRMMILGIASDADPTLILNSNEKLDGEQTAIAFASFVRKNPTAAREWLDNHLKDLPESERPSPNDPQSLPAIYVTRLLEQDWKVGLKAAEEYQVQINPLSLSKASLQQLEDAYHDSEDPAQKKKLTDLLMKAAFERNFDEARQQAHDLDLTHQDLISIHPHGVHSEFPKKAEYLNWIVESATQADDMGSISNAVFNTLQQWANADYEASAEWLSQQSPSPTRDVGIEGYVYSITRVDGEAATLWAAQIQDGQKQKKVLNHALKAWRKSDPEAAQNWEEANPAELE